ncbi:MAG: alpha/beta hydrolase [Burkholderiales bacterium]|nr:alpha/beta hydrolase [Burkholderiales bacterium]
MKLFLIILCAFTALVCVIIALALWLGGPGAAPPMPSINDPFKSVDFSDMPALKNYQGADGAKLFYREYAPQGDHKKGSAVLVHGSSGSSESLHPMATFLAAAGVHVYALDVRGHGSSVPKGHIAFVGQLESDLQLFVNAVQPPSPSTLIGFSSGGGFVLRVAASEMQSAFGSYLLLAPFLGHTAPNYRPDSGGWVSVGVPRIVALNALNAIGIRYWNDLPVVRFALTEEAKSFLTPEYDFNLNTNFAANPDYRQDLMNAKGKVAILAGDADELMKSQELQGIVQRAGKDWPVQLLPGIGHIPLTLDKAALKSVVEQVIH